MDDLNRGKLNQEISRVHDKLKSLDPTTEEYKCAAEQLVKLTDLANKDDETYNRYDVEKLKLEQEERLEKEKLDQEASLESFKRGQETERMEFEQKQKDVEAKRTRIQLYISGGITLLTFAGTWIANAISQSRSEYFEQTGNAYTSRFSRFQNKEPNHPGIMKK